MRVMGIVMGILLGSLWLGVSTQNVQGTEQILVIQATPEPTADAALTPLEQDLLKIEQATSSIRELEPLRPITRHFPTRDELASFLVNSIDEQLDEETAFKETQFYAAFDFLPADVDLRQIYLELLTAQVAGFYDTDTQEMNVILIGGGQPGDVLPLLERITYAHEYVHALQDQHFDLDAIGFDPKAAPDNPDRLVAIQALIEGDATLAMNDYTVQVTQENPIGAALQLLIQGTQIGGLSLPPGTPQILQQELLFPYFTGLGFVQALHRAGGWARIDQAFIDLPQSSEQIIHPQRYLDGDLPQTVTLNTITLGADWELLMERTMGEFYLREYLDTQLETPAASIAAEGWGGDRYQIYYNATAGQRAWVLRIVWDTPEDAAQFADAFADFGAARFTEVTPEAGCWVAADVICMTGGTAESIISYAPSLDIAQTLLNTAD